MPETGRSPVLRTVPGMETYVVRLWVPDRPGALGAVASRIGALRGDVIGIDILERGDGLAVDELVVVLPGVGVVDLLVREISEVDGVQVEEVRVAGEGGHDPRLDALETAALLIGADTRDELLAALCTHGGPTVGATWMVVLEPADGRICARTGDHPAPAWLTAFVAGSQTTAAGTGMVRRDVATVPGDGTSVALDVAWAPLPAAGLAVVFGRRGTVIRARERRQLAALARIVDTRLRDLAKTRSRTEHPSGELGR